MSGTFRGTTARSGFSMVGLLVTMVCIVILTSLLLTSLNKAVTGEGSQHEGTVHSFVDKEYLYGLFQSMAVHAPDNKDVYLVPSELSGSKDISQNTTANLFSAMVMQNYTPTKQLISGNEYSGFVEEKVDYDSTLYNPRNRVFWDPTFQADLLKMSNVSFAHLPLFGDRFNKQWRATMDSNFPLLGNRGPKEGIDDPKSMSYGKNGIWGGHILFGDGHVVFINSFTPNGMVYQHQGQGHADNIFKMDDGPNGSDAVLGFTKSMSKKGPELQND